MWVFMYFFISDFWHKKIISSVHQNFATHPELREKENSERNSPPRRIGIGAYNETLVGKGI
jgi:hypothetical protein